MPYKITDRDTNDTDLTEGSTNLFSQWLENGADLYYSGNVGIGTSSPQTVLHLFGTEGLRVERNGLGSSYVQIETNSQPERVTAWLVDLLV